MFPRLAGAAYADAGRPLFEFLRNIGGDVPAIVSHESLSGDLLGPDYSERRLRSLTNLSRMFPGSRLLLVLREPSAWLASVYREYLHQGGADSFEAFARPYLATGALDFHGLIEALRAMPFERLLVLDFDILVQEFEAGVEAISRFAGLPEQDKSAFRPVRVNGGVRNLGARLLRRANPLLRSRYNRRGLPLTGPVAKRLISTPRFWIQRGALRFLNRIGPDVVPADQLAAVREQWAANWQAVRSDFLGRVLQGSAGEGQRRDRTGMDSTA